MNDTFQRVAAHCGLRLSYYSTAVMLALAFLGLSLTEYRSASPLYILLVLTVLPSITKSMFFSEKTAQKRENLPFPLFCKKYHYDPIMYKSMNLAYLLLFVLLAAWLFSYRISENTPAIVSILPAITGGLSLLIRVLGIIGYRMYFHLCPLKAMH